MKRLAAYPAPRATVRLVPKRWLLAGIGLCLLALPLFKAIQIGLALRQAYSTAAGFSRVVKSGLDANTLALAQSLLANAADDVAKANAEMDFFRPSLRQLRWLPRYGPTLAALPTLLEGGSTLSQLAVSGFEIAQPLLTDRQGTLPIERLPLFLQNAKPQLAQIQQQTNQLAEQLTAIAADELRWGLAEPVANLQAAVTLLAAGLRVSEALPDLVGVEQMRTYLILVQNNHELRATGGFITSIGRLTVADGQIIVLEFADSYVDDDSALSYPAAPLPMQRYMHIDQMLLRDVNWSPDLPTTARLAQALYAQSSGTTVDGVITIDLYAVEQFVSALAPLNVPGVEGAITAENFVTRAKGLWAAPAQSDATLAENSADWWRQRKDFIPLVAKAAFTRLQQGDFNYLHLAQALHRALQTRALQLWFANPALRTELAQLHWDGGLHPRAGADFLAVVESNFGYNKVNAVVERALDYNVQWPQGTTQPGLATVTLTYRHPQPSAENACDPRPRYGLSYDDMMARCYFSFVRLYVPAGSTLLDSTGVAPDSVLTQAEGESQLFGGYFVLAPGEQTQIRFQYRLPVGLQAQDYQLVLQKQAGTAPLPFTAQVHTQSVATTVQQGWFQWQPDFKE